MLRDVKLGTILYFAWVGLIGFLLIVVIAMILLGAGAGGWGTY